ncbi:LysM peptidoglycan-binding domain-containing protein, partial [Rhizobium leguminosarum]
TEPTPAPAAPTPAAPAPAAPAPAPAPTTEPAPAPAASTPAATTPSTHVIAAGDTFWDLAVTFYGDGTLWRKLSDANGKPNPRHLTVGKEIEVPAK